MGHDHSHTGHPHGGHSHGGHSHGAGAGKRALAFVFALTAAFLALEVVGGLLTGSLALLGDAGHMASDAVSVWFFVGAFSRLQDPPPILGGWMMAVAVVGLAINVTGALVLSRSGGESLNVEGALRHVIAVLILGSSWKLLRESTNILLESTPKGVDAEKVGRKMASVPGVEEVHDLHIWTITSGFPALAAHVLVGASENCHARRRDLEAILARDFGIHHTTLQVDHEHDESGLLQIGVARR